jgi:hypothetical protein
MTEEVLKLEIGSEAFSNLTSAEVAHIVEKYSDVKLAGMKAFELLWKKFKPTYRMGKLYEEESDKYQAYKEMYLLYTKQLGAGIHTSKLTNVNVKRGLWSE